jgi:hypothetical protein
MVGSLVKWQILTIAVITMKGGVSQQLLEQSQFRQQQSIRRILISRIEGHVACFSVIDLVGSSW